MISRRRWLGAALTGLCAPVASRAFAAEIANADAQTLDAADVHVAGYPTVAAVRWLGDTLERESEGRLHLRQYHSGQLGREADSMSLTRFGALAMSRVTVASVNNAFPQTALLSLPYVFDDVAHLRRGLDGEPGRRILESFETRGMVALCFYDAGVRCVYNTRRPIEHPKDMHGLRLRVPPSDIFLELMRAYGVNATPLAYGEVYSGLQTHLIDGAENNWPSFHSSRQFEVAPYWSQTEHSQVPEVLLFSPHIDAKLIPKDRELIRDVARRSVPVMRQLWDARVNEARAAAVAGGVKINSVDRAAFQAAASPLLQSYLQKDGAQDLYREIRELSGVS